MLLSKPQTTKRSGTSQRFWLKIPYRTTSCFPFSENICIICSQLLSENIKHIHKVVESIWYTYLETRPLFKAQTKNLSGNPQSCWPKIPYRTNNCFPFSEIICIRCSQLLCKHINHLHKVVESIWYTYLETLALLKAQKKNCRKPTRLLT